MGVAGCGTRMPGRGLLCHHTLPAGVNLLSDVGQLCLLGQAWVWHRLLSKGQQHAREAGKRRVKDVLALAAAACDLLLLISTGKANLVDWKRHATAQSGRG